MENIFFLKRVEKAVRNPKKALFWLYLNFRPKIYKINPITVSIKDANRFFYHEKKQTKKLVKLVKPFLKESNTIFDIGSNCGYLSKEILDSGYKGRIILFEPIPNLMSISVKLLSNFVNQKTFVNSALGDKDEEIDLILPKDGNIGWITAVHEKADSEKIIKVRQENTLFYIKLFRPEFCKIDVEGYEYFILKCFLGEISKKYKPVFLIELGWGSSNPHWHKLVNLISEFQNLGYALYFAETKFVEIDLITLKNFNETIDVLLCQRRN